MSENLKYVDVSIVSIYDYEDDADEVTVAIGDGKIKFDDDFDFDARVYFYFDDQAQFDRARVEAIKHVGFKIIKILDE